MSDQLKARIENDFKPHEINQGQDSHMMFIRSSCSNLAIFIAQEVPPGREQALALTKLEEVMFWANAGIARTPQP